MRVTRCGYVAAHEAGRNCFGKWLQLSGDVSAHLFGWRLRQVGCARPSRDSVRPSDSYGEFLWSAKPSAGR